MPSKSFRFLLVALCAVALRPAAAAPELVELIPDEQVAWGPGNIVVGISSFLGRWNYWYAEREVLVETVPADSDVGLYYIRSNFQKRFERAETPVRLKLPARVDTTTKDNVKIHVMANGYQSKDVSFKSRDMPSALVIQLEPLPNSLVFFGHTDLAGRTTLTLRTTEEPEIRVSKSKRFNGFTLALTQTAQKLEETPEISGGQVGSVEVAQVAEDTMIRVKTNDPDVEVRSKSGFDPIREEHIFTLDLTPAGALLPSDADIRADLAATSTTADGCSSAVATAMREQIDRGVIARSFRPSGSLADLYRREAMRRLGRTARGTVRTSGGDTLRIGSPIELELAMQSAGDVQGYFELLANYARRQPDPETALRSLVASELGSKEFAEIYASAGCR